MATFRATIMTAGKTATGIVVPPRVVDALGAGKRAPVQVTLNGHTYRSTIAVMGGQFLIPVSAEVRAAARVAGGDTLDVDVALDTAPRTVAVPADLSKALARDAKARRRFEALSYTHRKEMARSLEDAKAPETRARRLAKALAALRGSLA